MNSYIICSCVCVCVCACTNRYLMTICVFNRISADIRAVGMSPVVKLMPINVLSILKRIDVVNVCFFFLDLPRHSR